MRRSRRSSDMWKVVIGALLAIALVVAIVYVVWLKYAGDRAAALREAKSYASNLRGVTAIECVAYDSDGDGYVSCTIFRAERDPIHIECAGALTLNSGCREPKAVVRSR